MSKLAGEMGFQLSQDIIIVRAVVTVERGKSMFQLHAVLSNQLQGTGAVANRNAKKTKAKKRSERNEKLKYPMRILALRENENLID